MTNLAVTGGVSGPGRIARRGGFRAALLSPMGCGR
jgi:hypothetical protein